MVSAIWHGFYPFYYIMFGLCAVFVQVAKEIYRTKIIFDFIPHNLRGIIENFLSMLVCNYLGICFCCLTIENGFMFLKSTNYFIPIILLTLLFIFSTGII